MLPCNWIAPGKTSSKDWWVWDKIYVTWIMYGSYVGITQCRNVWAWGKVGRNNTGIFYHQPLTALGLRLDYTRRTRSKPWLLMPWAQFLSLARSKLRLCLANYRAGYFSNLACDWLSIVWAYSKQEKENGPWFLGHCLYRIDCQVPVFQNDEFHRCYYNVKKLPDIKCK